MCKGGKISKIVCPYGRTPASNIKRGTLRGGGGAVFVAVHGYYPQEGHACPPPFSLPEPKWRRWPKGLACMLTNLNDIQSGSHMVSKTLTHTSLGEWQMVASHLGRIPTCSEVRNFRQWVPGTSGWVSKAVMVFKIHLGVRNAPWCGKCIKGRAHTKGCVCDTMLVG